VLPLAAVLAVADVLAPLCVAFAHREVGHEAVGCGAVPLAPRSVDDVAGGNGDDRLAAGLDAPLPFGNTQRLADRVAVLDGARSRREVHRADADR
jgi:hypothetical protein